MKVAAFALTLLAAELAAQTVIVTGSVTNAITHEPIAEVEILLAGAGTAGLSTGRADKQGAFRIAGVRPGKYQVHLIKTGFDAHDSGLQIDGGADPAPIELTMMPWPGLSGRVLDPERNPAPRVTVAAVLPSGMAPLSTVTDAEGRFSFRILQPGRYTLLADALPQRAGATELAPTYYPSAVTEAEAQRVVVAAGADLSAFDIVLSRVPVFRVSGKVVDERGEPAPDAAISIETAREKATTRTDGTFELPRVRPGDAPLRVDWKRGDLELRGFVPIAVARHDIENLTVRVAPPVPVSGTIELDGKPAPGVEGSARLEPLDWRGPKVRAEFKDGAFRFESVYPGRYRLDVQPGWVYERHYLDSVRLGESDITFQEIEVAPGMVPFRVVLKTGGGRVRGTVQGGEGGMIALVPQEPRMRMTGIIAVALIRGTQFELSGLRPGDYYAVAFREGNFNTGQMHDPEYAAQWLAGSPAIRVEQNSTATLTLLYVKLPSSQ